MRGDEPSERMGMKTPTQVSTPRYHTNDVPSFGFMSSRGSFELLSLLIKLAQPILALLGLEVISGF